MGRVIDLVAQAANTDTSLTPVVITGGAALTVGFIGGAVAMTTGLLGRRVEREKLAHEKTKFAAETRAKVKDEWMAVVEAMDVIASGDVIELSARQVEANKALKALLAISFTMENVGGRDLEELLDHLQRADEASLAEWRDPVLRSTGCESPVVVGPGTVGDIADGSPAGRRAHGRAERRAIGPHFTRRGGLAWCRSSQRQTRPGGACPARSAGGVCCRRLASRR